MPAVQLGFATSAAVSRCPPSISTISGSGSGRTSLPPPYYHPVPPIASTPSPANDDGYGTGHLSNGTSTPAPYGFLPNFHDLQPRRLSPTQSIIIPSPDDENPYNFNFVPNRDRDIYPRPDPFILALQHCSKLQRLCQSSKESDRNRMIYLGELVGGLTQLLRKARELGALDENEERQQLDTMIT